MGGWENWKVGKNGRLGRIGGWEEWEVGKKRWKAVHNFDLIFDPMHVNSYDNLMPKCFFTFKESMVF